MKQTIVVKYFIVFILLFSIINVFTSCSKVNLFTTLESVLHAINKRSLKKSMSENYL